MKLSPRDVLDVPLPALFFACLQLVIAVMSATATSYWHNRIKDR